MGTWFGENQTASGWGIEDVSNCSDKVIVVNWDHRSVLWIVNRVINRGGGGLKPARVLLLLSFLLLFQRKSRRYYPTRLAINLSSGISGTTVDTHNQGFIVVETNYRIYAYTGQRSKPSVSLLVLVCFLLWDCTALSSPGSLSSSPGWLASLPAWLCKSQIMHMVRLHLNWNFN